MRRSYNDWKDDPGVHAILKDVIRSSKKSYYRVNADGKHVIAPVKLELMSLHINGVFSSRILQEYPFPVGKFMRNRKIDESITEEALAARREKQAQRAVTAEAKNKKESDAMKAIQAIEQVPEPILEIEEVLEESASEEMEISANEETAKCGRPGKVDPEELMENKNHCLIQRGEWFGIFHCRDATVHLISKDREEAVEVLARYGRVKECFRWN